jgi:diketogulonate reductase-like aldo/keto reductase
LAWALARNLAVIPKSVEQSRLVENLEAANVKLTAEEVRRISDLNVNLRVGMSPLLCCKTANKFSGPQLNDPVDIDPRLGIWA